MIIDFHTHILPGIDDGSKNIKMSFNMLQASGADVCVATHHFYGDRQKLSSFVNRRECASKVLISANAKRPLIAIGAEVALFPGISRAEGMDQLCIKGTDLLLLELPYATWDSEVIREVERMTRRYEVVLAHLERFMSIRGNSAWIKELQQLPVHVQLNAESICSIFKRFQVKRLVEDG